MRNDATVDRHEVHRLRYSPGQDLLASDFRDLLAFQAQLGAWHNRALHEAFGVRYGLRVTLDADGARVARGLGYDAAGQPLLLLAPRVVALPAPGSDPLVLVLHRPPAPRRACSHRGLELAPLGLSWRPERQWRGGGGVPLARLIRSKKALALDDEFDPPLARPLAKPRIAVGSTVVGGTAWQLWQLPTKPAANVGIQLPVDTRASGFTRTPCYFAWVRGTLEVHRPVGGVVETLYIPLRVSLSLENAGGFRVRIPLQAGALLGTEVVPLLAAARQRLSICWIGVQDTLRADPTAEVRHGHP